MKRSCLIILLSVFAGLVFTAVHADTVLRRTTLLVHDLDRSIDFYASLGLKPFYDAQSQATADETVIGGADLPLAGEPTASRIVILIGPDDDTGMIGLLAYTEPPLSEARRTLDGLGRGDVVLMFYVDDIQATFGALQGAGTRFHRRPYPYEVRNNQGELRSAGWRMFAYDPDGRLIEIAQRD